MLKTRPSEKKTVRPTLAGSGALAPLAQVLAGLAAVRPPSTPLRLPLDEAIGRVLAEPLVAPQDCPAQAVALREGYAVRSTDLVGASPYSPVWVAREPIRVVAGQTLPVDADAVLPPDALERRGGLTEISQAVPPGHDVRRAGEDAAAGAVLRPAGRILSRRDAACARAAGLSEASVRPVTVTLLAGNEASTAASLVTACAHRSGGTVRVADQKMAPLAQVAVTEDLFVIIANDPAAIRREMDEVIAAGVAIRPGDQIVCGRMGGVPVLGVSTRLEAALAACLLILRPCLDHLTGAAPRSGDLSGRLTRKVSSAIGLTEIVLLKAFDGRLEPLAVGDLTLSTIAAADGWMAVPADSEGYAEGSPVTAFTLHETFG